MQEYPELLRDAAPGRTPVGEDPKFAKSNWRMSFQKRRDDLARIGATARQYGKM